MQQKVEEIETLQSTGRGLQARRALSASTKSLETHTRLAPSSASPSKMTAPAANANSNAHSANPISRDECESMDQVSATAANMVPESKAYKPNQAVLTSPGQLPPGSIASCAVAGRGK